MQYAGQLAEAGLIADAIAYSGAAMQLVIKVKSDRAAVLSFNPDAMLAAATDWHTRLKAHGAATGASHTRCGQSVVSRFGNFLDRTVMSMLGAAEVNPNPASISPTPGLSKSGSAASLGSSSHPPRASGAPPPIQPSRGSWGGNEFSRGVSAADVTTSHPAAPLQPLHIPLHMRSASNASTPRACSASRAPSGAGISHSVSPRSAVNNTSPPAPAPTGFAGPQGIPLGASSAARNASSWSGVPGPNDGGVEHHAAPLNSHRRQVSESALAGNAAHSNRGNTATTETRAGVSKGWFGGLAARILPGGSSSKENVAGLSGSNSDSDLPHSVGKPPVAPSHQPYAYSGLAPPPADGAWGDGAGAVHSAPQLPPSNTSAPAFGSRGSHDSNASQWSAPPGVHGMHGGVQGGTVSHAPHASAPGFFSTSAPMPGSVMQPGVPAGSMQPPTQQQQHAPMYLSNTPGAYPPGAYGQQQHPGQHGLWNASGTPGQH